MAQATAALLLLAALAAGGVHAQRNRATPQRPDIRALEIRSDVRYRYARTEVFSRVANPANESQEVTFSAVLPDDAFVSSFAITVGERVYPARVEGREEARQEYRAAVSAGRTAAHVQVSARDANQFTVSLNVAANDKAAFNLTYEQLLSREQGRYRLRIMLDPGQVVQRLLVEARIRDSANLTLVRVANLRAADNEVDSAAQELDDPLATVVRLAPGEALVRWEPDEAAQRSLAGGRGLQGLLEVQYDVDHSGNSKLLVGDGGYFVHFFSPPDDEIPPLTKHVVFLLDVSASMEGRKIQQLREAMVAILAELREGDAFSLLTFSSETSVWVPDQGFRRVRENVRNTVVPATREAIAQAQEAARRLTDDAWTHLHDGLQAAYRAVREGRELVSNGSARQPLIILLTDGQPNGPHSTREELVGAVAAATADPSTYAPLYSLAFGNDADFGLLKKLSLRGKGFARKIYEAADAALQLRNFYRRVASPLLANVTFQYADDQVESPTLTQSVFPVLLAGTELAVAGRLPSNDGAVEGTPEDWSRLRAAVRGASAGLTIVERPATVQRLEPQQSTFVERLWAYLTVRQLLERANGDDAAARARARELALRYAFVTSLTSLVVVKPDNQTSGADLRDASAVDSPTDVQYDSTRHPHSRTASFGMIMPGRMASPGRMSMPGWMASIPRRSNVFTSEITQPANLIDFDADDDEPDIGYDAYDPSSLLISPSTSTAEPTSVQPPPFVVPLANLTWLSDGVAGNGSHVFVSVAGQVQAFLATEPAGDLNLRRRRPGCGPASTGAGAGPGRGGGQGRGRRQRGARCLPLARCALQEFAEDFNAFLSRFCAIESHAGVCCPRRVVRSLRGRGRSTW